MYVQVLGRARLARGEARQAEKVATANRTTINTDVLGNLKDLERST